ncbi:transporter substrate-binding domain-containing protein [Duncaniella dubosii]|uniref:transporter substrate-binding domain-containing protein n=1 Tax=Duncaniella dubosii TaxID=2518971 RepID=UPI0023F1C3F5|nr:transporter substrate-binding domain-containing protein [Duncaniella dubosii]MCX4283670.1 transporter substrate-binding domain-containing protein [Duncaniella dubosii]
MKKLKGIGTGRLSLYLGLLLAAFITMWLIRTCSIPSPFSKAGTKPSGGDTLDVAIDYGPMSLFTYDDTLGGFNYDMIRGMATANGLKVKFHPVTTPGSSIEGLENGLYDIVVSDIAATAEASENVVFTEPVYLDKQVLVQKKDSLGNTEVSSQLDLAGREVWVTSGSPSAMRLRNLSAEIGDTILVKEDPDYGSEQLVMMVAVGDIPLAVVNEKTALRLAGEYPGIDVSTAISFTQFQTWALRKKEMELTDSVNSMIKRYKQTDGYKDLLRRYGI